VENVSVGANATAPGYTGSENTVVSGHKMLQSISLETSP